MIVMLTPAELLDFEAEHPGHQPGKEDAIIRQLGIPPARYYQLLHRAARSAEGIAYDPITARLVRDLAA
jgi:hypothetical protein